MRFTVEEYSGDMTGRVQLGELLRIMFGQEFRFPVRDVHIEQRPPIGPVVRNGDRHLPDPSRVGTNAPSRALNRPALTGDNSRPGKRYGGRTTSTKRMRYPLVGPCNEYFPGLFRGKYLVRVGDAVGGELVGD